MSSHSPPLKIALILDNPTRDLDGLVLLARELAIRGHDCFLVPMYSLGYEIPALVPDFVLFNYARTANTQVIKSLNQAGLQIGILDTEGGIWESAEQYIKSIAQGALEFADQYYVWGPVQKKAFADFTNFATNKVFVTGCPRYDFCVEPWIKSIESPAAVEPGYVLIISNFALSHPRFATPATELNNMVAAGYERSYAESRAEDERISRKRLIGLILKSATKFPDKNFVVRTHPFEDDREYKTIFGSYKNIKVVREFTVSTWLKSAAVVLHLNSSVGVDAALMHTPVFTADWISTGIAKGMSDLSLKVSTSLKSEEAFFTTLQALPAAQAPASAHPALYDWFYLSDGKAHERVAELIETALSHRTRLPDPALCRKMFFYGSKSRTNWIGYIDALGRLAMGAKNYKWLRNNVLTKNILRRTKSEKFFSKEQINAILAKLNQVETAEVTAIDITSAQSLFKNAVSESVYIPAQSKS